MVTVTVPLLPLVPPVPAIPTKPEKPIAPAAPPSPPRLRAKTAAASSPAVLTRAPLLTVTVTL